MNGKYEKPKKKPRKIRRVLVTLFIVIFFLVTSAVIALAAYYNYALNKIRHVDVPKIEYTTQGTDTEKVDSPEETLQTSPVADATEPTIEKHISSSADYINFLLVGQASRAGEAERFADTMILCTVNTYEKS